MPVSIDCPSCKGHLLIPDTLWRQRFVGRVQRMTCKKCRGMIEIDGRGPELGGGAALERVSRIPPRPTGGLVGPALGASMARAEAVLALEPEASREMSALAQPSVGPAPRSTSAASRPIMPDLSDPNLWLHLAHNVASSEPPPSTSGTVLRKRFAARRTRWIGISGLAALALATAGWWVFGAERGSASSGAPTTPSSAAQRLASDDTRSASAPEATAAIPTPIPVPTQGATATEQASSPASTPPYDTVKLKQILRWAVRNGQECHKWGRSVGTAELFITFSPSGKVSQAELVGEPIASAPVARCILDYARAIFLPPFDGPSFTVSRTITLR